MSFTCLALTFATWSAYQPRPTVDTIGLDASYQGIKTETGMIVIRATSLKYPISIEHRSDGRNWEEVAFIPVGNYHALPICTFMEKQESNLYKVQIICGGHSFVEDGEREYTSSTIGFQKKLSIADVGENSLFYKISWDNAVGEKRTHEFRLVWR